jgi:hypothetical protein
MLPFEIPVVEMPHDERCCRSGCSKAGRDIVTGDYVRLLAGWEGEDGNPGSEDISERVHLNQIISCGLLKEEER